MYDDDSVYWTDEDYDRADAMEAAAQELYDQDDLADDPKYNLVDVLSLSIWEHDLARPDYYDWFLSKVRP